MGIDLLKDIYNPLAKREESQHLATVQDEAIATSGNHSLNHLSLSTAPIGAVSKPAPLNSWHDSAPIMRLSEYMKERKKHGIRIIRRGNIPALRFNPGLGRKDTEARWQIAHNIELLFWEAYEDLTNLIRNNRLTDKDIYALGQ